MSDPTARVFLYTQLTLVDPDPALSPEEVKTFYASLYPELTQATIEGPEEKDGRAHYTFRKVAGTKGARERPHPRDTRPPRAPAPQGVHGLTPPHAAAGTRASLGPSRAGRR